MVAADAAAKFGLCAENLADSLHLMHEAVSAHLAAWESFYIIVGSSAGALTGLQFVVMALVAEARQGSSRPRGLGVRHSDSRYLPCCRAAGIVERNLMRYVDRLLNALASAVS
jgi:hypothetical protein